MVAMRVASSLIFSSVLLLLARGASAQSPARLGLQAGATIPVSSYGTDKHAGYHLGLLVDVRTPLPLFGFRIEGVYHELKYSGNTTRAQIWTAAGDAELKIPTGTPVLPYAIGGVGIYSSHRSLLLGSKAAQDFGANIGGGLRFELHDATAYVEARYHRAGGSDGIRFVPISLGLLF